MDLMIAVPFGLIMFLLGWAFRSQRPRQGFARRPVKVRYTADECPIEAIYVNGEEVPIESLRVECPSPSS